MKGWKQSLCEVVLVMLVMLFLAVLAQGCRTPFTRPAEQVLHDPNSDLVALQAQLAASKAGQVNIAENISQLQDDGWAYWLKEKRIARMPDDNPIFMKLPNGMEVPVWDEYESLGKWNLVNTLNGTGESLGQLELLDFSSGLWRPGGACADANGEPTACEIKHYATGRDGFRFLLKGAKGNVGVDASTIRAKYEGQVAVKTALAAGLGTAIEQHWAGKAGLLKVGLDGTVSILKEGREIAGEFIKLTPLGAAANGLEQIAVTIKEAKGGKTQTEILTQPADAGK